MKPTYESPLASRYASKYMLHLFSPDSRFETWRRLWVALAQAQHDLGLPAAQAQVDELAAHGEPDRLRRGVQKGRRRSGTMMAHIYVRLRTRPGQRASSTSARRAATRPTTQT
ncbi:MAG: hypothetical protein ACLR8U_04800 [Oscillospiraceae bacterium]